MTDIPVPAAIFHQPVRTRLAVILFLGEASFSELKGRLKITDGNLDAHLKKLAAAGYLQSRMELEGRPHTVYRLSESGTQAFQTYLDDIEIIVNIANSGCSQAN